MCEVIDGGRFDGSHPGLFRDVFLFGEEGIPLQGNKVINRFVNFPDDQLLIWLMMHQNGNLEKIEGVTLPLYGDWSDNFWHWCFEALPVALAAHEGGFRGTYLVPDTPFAAASLRLLGIRPDLIRCVAEGSDYYLECMCLPGKVPGYDIAAVPAVTNVRSRLRGHFADASASHRLYISRNGSPETKRQVINEPDLATLLQRFGFSTLCMERLSLEEQLAYTCNATAMVGPHGAGMTHAAFMPEGSLVLELFAPTYINACMLWACREFRHRYFQVTSTCSHGGYLHGEDIVAFLQMIETTLERELC